ncbi:hypothetical protein ACRALDRAFT_1060756 [Sodiomyces alcalophilus JCM 7366]|uniref:uncharacterized protein n=1 Tax=Sodiomyces alcalophilus JCM 7366 TaxID=591952 RepID=UPI0039B68B8C
MDLRRDWDCVGARTYTKTDSTGNIGSVGEGDSCRRPVQRRPDKFPTLAIEASYVQSWVALHIKARWWFKASHYEVKVVLLVRADKSARRIRIEKWRRIHHTSPPGCVQTIIIERPDGLGEADPASYEVTGGPLRLEFEDLFLREADGHRNEGDIVLGTDALQEYAAAVWMVTV